MKKLTLSLTILIVLVFSFVYDGATARADTTSTTKVKKVSKKQSTLGKDTVSQKKLPPCDVFLKDWGGRGGYHASGENSRGNVAPQGCAFVGNKDGAIVPSCKVDEKWVQQCEPE